MLAYLARYTHRVAIANSRLIALDEGGVAFRYKDYRRHGQARYRTMTLSADEFIRRFLLHVLPKGFHRIRHYGLLASAGCKANIVRARELIAVRSPEVAPPAAQDAADPDAAADHRPSCPCCGGRMIIVEVFGRGARRAARPPPPRAGFEPMTILIVTLASIRRNFPFPAPCSFYSGTGKRRHDTTDQSSIGPPATLATPNPQSSVPFSSRRSPDNHLLPTPHRDQIPITRPTARRRPAGSFFGGFRTPAPTLRRLLALGRHPKPFPKGDTPANRQSSARICQSALPRAAADHTAVLGPIRTVHGPTP